MNTTEQNDNAKEVGWNLEDSYITEARKKAIQYLGTKWVAHPRSTYQGSWMK